MSGFGGLLSVDQQHGNGEWEMVQQSLYRAAVYNAAANSLFILLGLPACVWVVCWMCVLDLCVGFVCVWRENLSLFACAIVSCSSL